MRLALAMTGSLFIGMGIAACQEIQDGLGLGGGADAGAAADAAAANADAGILGAGCGTEDKTGIQLCVATSKCPNVVIDGQTFPDCGFRIHGAQVDLVCACGTSICPMGVFATCDEATKLLAQQTEGSVCTQISDGRCIDTSSSSSSSTSSTSSSSTSSGTTVTPGNPACDRGCMQDCGGGSACASICNCD